MENRDTEIVKHVCAACDYNGDAVRVAGNVLCPQCGCPEDPTDAMDISDEEITEYIQDELLKEGIVVAKEDIAKVLYLQDEFMVRKGLAYVREQEGEPPDVKTGDSS